MQSQVHEVKYTTQIIRKKTKQGKYINQYMKVKTIGQGPFSKIKLYINTQTKSKVAIKKYNLFIMKKKTRMQRTQDGQIKYVSMVEDVRKQIEIMKIPKHQNIAKTYQIIQDKEQQKIYIVMDYCQHGDIAKWNHKTSKFQVNKHMTIGFEFYKKSFIQIAKGLSYLHNKNIVHRDIKPLNILINHQGVIKIIDFGRSVLLKNQNQRLKGSEGTYHFMAPEMLSEKFPQGYNGKTCDIWALGVSFYGIIFGELPFYVDPLIKLFQTIQVGKFQYPQKCQKYVQPFKPIINKMLSINPQDRYTAVQLIQVLQQLIY